ncbi:hypothetical protein WA026_000522 [Henosepilachna vigintioctopunctata]|uniref:Uncharacterized protein n=1 Tax=Henosepilachna vigintioctopunctata TaxID=420089 RepID=A0AAW1V7I2_9CUCU
MNQKLILMIAITIQLIRNTSTVRAPSSYNEVEARRGGNRRRPCVFRPKLNGGQHHGRTIFDWNFQHYDVSYNYNYNIDCSGGSGGGGHYSQGSHHQGSNHHGSNHHGSNNHGSNNHGSNNHGSNHQGSGVDSGGLLSSLLNRPQSGGIPNIPGIPQIGNGISQSQSQTQAATDDSAFSGFLSPNRPLLSGIGSLIGNIPHNPVAEGIGSIGQGIGSILQIIPQTVQSFTSSLSSTGGFFPQGIFSNFGSLFNRPSTTGPSGPTTNVPQVTTPIDPDDIIYNDESVTPIHTPDDPIFPDAYSNVGKPRPGLSYRPNSHYNRLPYYNSRYRGF